jgi:hypothetical protein
MSEDNVDIGRLEPSERALETFDDVLLRQTPKSISDHAYGKSSVSRVPSIGLFPRGTEEHLAS